MSEVNYRDRVSDPIGKEVSLMRKLLAILVLGGAFVLSTSAAFAQDTMGGGPSVTTNVTGPYVVDNQTTPIRPNTQAK
jgi:hypothetical protein